MISRILKGVIVLLVISISLNSCSKDTTTPTTPTTGTPTVPTTPATPTTVTPTVPATPTITTTEQQKVFQEYWDTFDQYYALFHRKKIDWQDVYDTYYPLITATTTDEKLFEHFGEIMANVISDGHSSVIWSVNNTTSMVAGFTPNANQNIQKTVRFTYSGDGTVSVDPKSAALNSPYIFYGTLTQNPDIGYIRSLSFEPKKEENSERVLFKAQVDQALEALKDKKGIVIDVRENDGGQLEFASYFAGRFFALDNMQLFRSRYKLKTGSTEASLSDWVTIATPFRGHPDTRSQDGGFVAPTDAEEEMFLKSGTFQFTKKVAVLTSKNTASAAEFFTAAMMTQPHVKTIGNATYGVFSGVEYLILNNGNKRWKINLSGHDVELRSGNGFQSFEGIGITPDQILLPTDADVAAFKDVHFAAAATYINN